MFEIVSNEVFKNCSVLFLMILSPQAVETCWVEGVRLQGQTKFTKMEHCEKASPLAWPMRRGPWNRVWEDW